MSNQIITILSFCFFISTNQNIEQKIENLSKDEILHIASLIENDYTQENNIHILYTEIYNDSSFLLTVCQSSSLATKDYKLCFTLENETEYIFVYDMYDCEEDLVENLISKSNQVPFFTPGEKQISLLVRRRNAILMVDHLSVLPVKKRIDIEYEDPF